MFARQLLARVALRIGEELQRPSSRRDQPSRFSLTEGPQQSYNSYMSSTESPYATPFWFLIPPPLLLLAELAKQSRSGGQLDRNTDTGRL